MPAGIDDVSAAVSLVSFSFSLLQGCLKGLVLLSHVRRSKREISNLHLRCELEHMKLLIWGEKAGLLDEHPRLLVPPPVDALVPDILQQLDNLLGDLHVLKTRYGLLLEQTTENLTESQSEETTFARLNLQQMPIVQRIHSNTSTLLQTSPSPWKKLRWAALDEQRFRAVLDDASNLISQLQQLLPGDVKTNTEEDIKDLFRTAIAQNSHPRKLDFLLTETSRTSFLDALSAPARLKKKSALSGLFDRWRPPQSDKLDYTLSRKDSAMTLVPPRSAYGAPALTKPEPDSKFLCLDDFLLHQASDAFACRQLGYHNGNTPVLIEWRDIGGFDWSALEARADKFSCLLDHMAQYPSFHTLACLGFVKAERNGRYGYVFDLTPPRPPSAVSNASRTRSPLPTCQTLRDLLRNGASLPSLNVRVSIAITLLETVLQLHTAGWLHKEIRPANVLFTRRDGALCSDRSLAAGSVYIVGYVYARAEDEQEFTEPLKSNIEADLYRHPSVTMCSLRQPYCKAFDVFSVGCLLLELGLWSPMSDILTMSQANNQWTQRTPVGPPATPPATPMSEIPIHMDQAIMTWRREMLSQMSRGLSSPGNIVELLQARTGDAYTRIVIECLNVRTPAEPRADDHISVHGFSDDDREAIDLEARALKKLRSIVDTLG